VNTWWPVMARRHLLAADPTCAIIVSGSCPDREAVSGLY
jgi:hypothetical protein